MIAQQPTMADAIELLYHVALCAGVLKMMLAWLTLRDREMNTRLFLAPTHKKQLLAARYLGEIIATLVIAAATVVEVFR